MLGLAHTIEVGEGGKLPTEFLIFAAGENPNCNAEARGLPTPQFTARSAQEVMGYARQRGTDYSGDLEHASVDPETVKARADACDAMCWYALEVRDGALWATNVRWTDEGARRLRAGLQRYISPCWDFDTQTGEVVRLINVAITSNPATYGIAPLVAALRSPATPRITFTSAQMAATEKKVEAWIRNSSNRSSKRSKPATATRR